jgi:2,4-dienoyl-CoA reductase-like NADH-dependent reductase (Old Yellow Enzyme family)/thioredoxin reductase
VIPFNELFEEQKMNKMFPKLFERGKIGTLEVDNRIVKAPTQVNMLAPDGSVTTSLIDFFAEEARGGTGLIITGMAMVNDRETPPHPTLGIYKESLVPGLSALAQAIQYNGSRAAIQLVHYGSHAGSPLKCVSLKGVEHDIWFPVHHPEAARQKRFTHEEYTIEEIRYLVRAYGDAALRATFAGFDFIEVHGAHRHGLSLFLSPLSNQRTDEYGGCAENRRRILLEIISDIRGKIGRDYPLGVRLNWADSVTGGLTIEETMKTCQALEKAGVDVVHISGDGAAAPMSVPPGLFIHAAETIKKAIRIPVIASGCITTPELAEDTIANGRADFISFARPLFADPSWPLKAREGRPEDIRPCIRCNDGCIVRTGKGGILCSVNAALGKEALIPTVTIQKSKKVAVIGGGPAGLEAARVCALRGHQVTLFEKRQLGGALIEASVPEFKADLRRLISYLIIQSRKLKIEIVNQEGTAEIIRNGRFAAVIVAVGAAPFKPEVPGINKPIVVDALDILNSQAHHGQRIHIVGGGIIGAEVALFLAEQGKEIILTTRQPEIMSTILPSDRFLFLERLNRQKVTIYTGRQLQSINDIGTVVVDSQRQIQEIPVDQVVLASGYIPQTTLRDQLEMEPGLDVYAAGDCLGPRMIFDAVHEGHLVARKI